MLYLNQKKQSKGADPVRRSPHRFLPLLLVVPLILSLAPGVLANAPTPPLSCDVSPVSMEDFFVDLLILLFQLF